MIHLDIPHKPKIEDFGLNSKDFLSEKAKAERKAGLNDILDSIPWALILVIILYLFVGYFIWRHFVSNDQSLIMKIIKGVLSVLAAAFFIEFIVCALLGPFWFFKVLTDRNHPEFRDFVDDCINGLLRVILYPFLILGEWLSKFSSKKTTKVYQEYCEALSRYESDLIRLRNTYPLIDECNWDERLLTRRMVDALLPEAINASREEVESINKYSEKRWWKQLEAKQFEQEVSKWFIKQGYQSEVTQYVGDGGVDIIVEKDGQKGYVQCKHFVEDKVPVTVARELRGVMASDGISIGFIVCLNGLSSQQAYAFCKNNNITVIDLDGLLKGTERVPIQETEGSTDYIVGPFSIQKDVFCTKEEAISHFASKTNLSISILRIKDLYMIVHSNSNYCLHTNYYGSMGRVKVEYTRLLG